MEKRPNIVFIFADDWGWGDLVPEDLTLDGENVLDALTGTARPRTTPILWEWRFRVAGHVINRSPILTIRDGDWKLLLNLDGSREELYHIPSDPSELDNKAGRQPDRVRVLSERVVDWQRTLPNGPFDPDAGSNRYSWPGR